MSEQILIVEDEGIVAEDISESLRRLGYEKTAIVDTGEKAIEMSAQVHPRLVLMDIKLKGPMDGIEAAREIRKRSCVPVIYLSATADSKTIERARLTEPYGYLLKPYNENELRTTIEMALFKHEMELRLRQSERWYASTLRDIGDAVITTDDSGRVTFLNSIAENVAGFARGEALGKAIDQVWEFCDEKTGAPVESPVIDVLKRGQPVQLTGTAVRGKKVGTVVSIDGSAAPVRGEAGNLMGVVIVFHDVTDRQRIEENLRHAQKMEAVGTLASGIAHDFNNLLTVILGCCNLILGDCEDDVTRERAERIENAGKWGATLINQLLAFSRKQVFKPEVFDLRSLVQEMRGLLLPLIGADIGVKIKTGPDPTIICADRGQIGHMLTNLAVNARDAMPNGGLLTLVVENVTLTEPHVSRSGIVPPGSYVLFSVADTGCGMDESTLARIFEPFFTTKGPGKGTGLGLSMVYGIAQQCSARIGVKSAPGAGTTFRIYFPREQSRPASASAELSGADTSAPDSETVLIVDDEPGVRKVIARILAKNGYAILEASDGMEAVRVSEQHIGPIQLLLTDVIMPRMGGAQLAQRLRSLRPDTRVLFISGDPGGMIENEGGLRPGIRFLQKPFTAGELVAKVRDVLSPSYIAERSISQKRQAGS